MEGSCYNLVLNLSLKRELPLQFWVSTEKYQPRKKRLNKSANCFEISFLRRSNIVQDILFGLEALLESTEHVMLALFLTNKLQKCCTITIHFFNCRISILFIKDVSNIIRNWSEYNHYQRSSKLVYWRLHFLEKLGIWSLSMCSEYYSNLFQNICYNKPVSCLLSSFEWKASFVSFCVECEFSLSI